MKNKVVGFYKARLQAELSDKYINDRKHQVYEYLDTFASNYLIVDFFHSMQDRQLVWWNRNKNTHTNNWSPHNAIFAKYKFTNVYRELDRCSQYYINNVLVNNSFRITASTIDQVWIILLFRTFNVPELFEMLRKEGVFGFKHKDYDKEVLYEAVVRYRKQGGNPFTPSYLHGSVKSEQPGRDYMYCKKVIPQLHEQAAIIASYLDYNYETKLSGNIVYWYMRENLMATGCFMAHEYWLDMCYINKYKSSNNNVESVNKFCNFTENSMTNLGPGAERGIDILFPDNTLSKKDKILAIYYLTDKHSDYLLDMKYVTFCGTVDKLAFYDRCDDNYTLHQTEMWLCEYQKYMRCVEGTGRRQPIYKKENAGFFR